MRGQVCIHTSNVSRAGAHTQATSLEVRRLDMEDCWGRCDATEGTRDSGTTLRRGEGQRMLRHGRRTRGSGKTLRHGDGTGPDCTYREKSNSETTRQPLMDLARSC